MTGPTLSPDAHTADATHEVAAFAAAVRAHLDDLPPEEVEDLVDGLEADLIERTEDSGDPLGDAREYADELRSAAGLPPRDSRPLNGEWFGGYKRLSRDIVAWVRRERENPKVATVLDFLLALRPVWWVLRGWAAFRMTIMFGSQHYLPDSALGWLVLVAFVVVSVQWGRGRWLAWRGSRVAKTIVSVIVVFALPVLLWSAAAPLATDPSSSYVYDQVEVAPDELSVNGTQVTNVFPFDCAGEPLSGVQLFDQNGDPLAVGGAGEDGWIIGTDADGLEFPIVPNPAANADSGWNVFPLSAGEFAEDYLSVDPSSVEEQVPPFPAVQPLADPDETCAAVAPSDDPSAAPTPDPTPAG